MSDRIQDARIKGGWAMFDTALFDYGLSAYSIAVYAALLKYANSRTDTAFPGIGSLSKMIKVAPNTVRKSLQELAGIGIIKITHRPDPSNKKWNHTNLYTLLPMPLQGSASDEVGVVHQVKYPTSRREEEPDVLNKTNKTKTIVAPKSATDAPLTSDIYHAAQTNPATFDQFTSKADAMTNADTRLQPLEALKDEITAVWGWDNGGVLINVAKMLTGKFKAGEKHSEYKAYQFDTPMTADDLSAWAAWYRRAHPSLSLPQKPETIAKSVGEWRAAAITAHQRPAPVIPADDVLRRQAEERAASYRRGNDKAGF